VKRFASKAAKRGGLKKTQKSLKRWTDQEWTTSSGKPSKETGEVYLPKKKIAALKSTKKGRAKLARANTEKKKEGGTTKHGLAAGVA
jgi:hypothetical protein